MKQTAVEWMVEQIQNNIHHTIKIPIEYFEQALEMEKQQQDDFAIGFAEWCDNEGYTQVNNLSLWKSLDDEKGKYSKELLEIYKKDKGL
jgi:hypothetical protein